MGHPRQGEEIHTTAQKDTKQSNTSDNRDTTPCTCNTLLVENNILSIDYLYILRVCIELHPYIYPTQEDKTTDKPYTDNTFITITDVHSHNTRYSKGHIFSPNTNSKAKGPKHTMAHLTQKHTDIWNSLPSTLRNIAKLETFKKEIGKHLLKVQKEELEKLLQRGRHLG